MAFKVTTIALLAAALHSTGACADEPVAPVTPAAPMFLFSGFGTVGEVHSSEHLADFTSNLFKPNGAGYTRSWSADVDSLIAGQIDANFTPKLSAVLQIISEQNYDNTYTPHTEWANVKYQFTPDFSVRLGRTVLPIFADSDSRKIGYASLWVRPPGEVYRLIPVTNNDGLDVSYRMAVGAATNTFLFTAGQSNAKFQNSDVSGTAQTRQLAAFADTFEQGFATLRLNYGRSHLTIPEFNPLFNAFSQFGPQGIAIANQYNVNDRLITFYGIGATYDPGNWIVTGEWSGVATNSVIGRRTAWYVSGGVRFGKFTPFVAFVQSKADNLSDPGLTVAALPPFLAGPATGLNAALNTILRAKPVENTVSVGTRWDFMKNVDFKLQFDHTQMGTGSSGLLSNTQPGYQSGGAVNIFSAAIDFIF